MILLLSLNMIAQTDDLKVHAPPIEPANLCAALSLDVRTRSDGSIRSCVQLDGARAANGVAIRFHRSGSVAMVGTLQGAQMTGVWTAFSADGTRLRRGVIIDGKLKSSVAREEYIFKMRGPLWIAGDKCFWCSPESKPLDQLADVGGGSAQDCSEEF
jgi:hypothetical protein